MPHPLIQQLRFTRKEFERGLQGLSEAEARRRLLPMNCISWNVGHLAWQEQRYFFYYAQGQLPFPEVNAQFAYGAIASTPPLDEVLEAWRTITAAADPWLDSRTSADLMAHVVRKGRPSSYIFGSLVLRVIYHYWYHTGENMAIRQSLGHADLPEFVGDIDREAPYRPEQGD
ncbi:MAG TPA: DinB family protein [Anaerolineales bacterium]|jgi:hypothetical protein|nr:DinB family protein [Anaerolineales bacterium]